MNTEVVETAPARAGNTPAVHPARGAVSTDESPCESDGYSTSENLRERAHRLIPGGCHTAAKGDDQFPANAPAFIVRGQGCRIEDVEGRRYIEYAMGLRAVTLGHAWPSVIAAAHAAMLKGNNFNRPSPLEVECAEMFCSLVPNAEMVKFTKDGSTVNTAAVKLARAYTGRTRIAICSASPFFSYDDWFIGTTGIDTGIPDSIKALTLRFDYNDLPSLERLFDAYPGEIACVVMEPARTVEPVDNFLTHVQSLCARRGAVFILDETITGFRWHNAGAQHLFGVKPDLSCFGKALANGFSVSALAGRREIMELGGIRHTHADRVFLLSTTHGAESPGLAAAIETMRIYRDEPVIEHLYVMGDRLRKGIEQACVAHGVQDHFKLAGRSCNLMYTTLDTTGAASSGMRTLFLQEILARGVLAPSFLTAYSHDSDAIDETIDAVSGALAVYRKALEDGYEHYLRGPVTASVYRRRN